MSDERWDHYLCAGLLVLTLSAIVGVSVLAYREPTHHYRVRAVSGGRVVGEWRSVGKPYAPTLLQPTWSFRDADSGGGVEIAGDVIITPLD